MSYIDYDKAARNYAGISKRDWSMLTASERQEHIDDVCDHARQEAAEDGWEDDSYSISDAQNDATDGYGDSSSPFGDW